MNIEIHANHQPLRQIVHKRRRYLVVPDGAATTPLKYEIVLTNGHVQRRLGVVSVDGLNVVNGEEAGSHDTGFVVDAGGRMTIKGWCRGNEEAASFQFSAKELSYGAQTGRPDNVGVIGLAWYDEKRPEINWVEVLRAVQQVPVLPIVVPMMPTDPNPWRDPWRYPQIWCGTGSTSGDLIGSHVVSSISSVVSSTGAGDLQADEIPTASVTVPLGTSYGPRVEQHLSTCEFERDGKPHILELRYGTEAQLRAWGVPVDRATAPKAFPATTNYAPPPPGWGGLSDATNAAV